MSFLSKYLKKFLILTITLSISLSLTDTFAQDATGGETTNGGTTGDPIGPSTGDNSGTDQNSYLKAIMVNTYGVLEQINYLPYYLTNLNEYVSSWLASDDKSDASSALQSGFTTYGNSNITTSSAITSLQPTLLAALFQNITPPLKNANDLSYQSLLGMPYVTPDPRQNQNPKPNPTLEYLKHASGINMPHVPPDRGWSGNPTDVARYWGYYNTVMAATTYNAYALSDAYTDGANASPLSTLQTLLYTQATSSNWFVDVAGSQNLGAIFRQMLMFQSQAFVLLAQLLETQKKLLTATAINNTLLILLVTTNEPNMLNRATTRQP